MSKNLLCGAIAVAATTLMPAPAIAGDRVSTVATLREVQKHPESWRNTPFVFEGRYHRPSEIYQPFYTTFDSFTHANFAAWDAGEDLSRQGAFKNSFPLLYMDRKYTHQNENLRSLVPFQRFRATAVVKDVFAGRPWILVNDLVPLDQDLSPEEHRNRALSGADLAKAPCGCEAHGEHAAGLAAGESRKQRLPRQGGSHSPTPAAATAPAAAGDAGDEDAAPETVHATTSPGPSKTSIPATPLPNEATGPGD